MKNIINELWHGNIIPQEDSRNNSKEMKELLGYMARHHEDSEKTFTDEQKEIFEKFHVAKSETNEYRFGRVKPPKARSWQSRASVGDRQRLCDGGERLVRVRKPCRSSYLRIRLPPRSEFFYKSNSVTRQSNTPKGRFLAKNMIKYVQKERRCFYGVFRKTKRTA